ncbi:MAG: ParB/RepB/Spo0J family partition protein [Archangium sp.]|nr:ParB/RepB/Spo0J family partition protein [Archangium sp.]MDP3155510.1 ParB/RepB/Spo0J family partition protein [Archangium sp.]MDP3573842.1 ParB/RepB/Spo0J family partition protein [Archangium sp.]
MSEGVNNDTPATAGEEAAVGAPTPMVEEQPSAPAEASEPSAPAQETAAEEEAPPPPPPSAPALPQVEETPVIHKHFVAPALIPLDRIDEDTDFLVRGEAELEDIAGLATDIARLGQLFPIDVRLRPPDRFQVITGFRRVSALRFLQREKVLARLHTDLSDADAMLMTLASAIHSKTVGLESLSAIRASLEESGRLSPSARDMLEKALSSGDDLSPESVEEEVDADELAADVTVRLGQANQDLSLLADVFSELDETRREELLKQLRYSAELVAFLESKQ